MKKLMALVLSLGLVLLGTAPVMAAGQAAKAEPPARQQKVVQVVLPQGEQLQTDELKDTTGELDFFLVGSGVFNTINGFRNAVQAAETNNVTGVFIGMGQFLFGVAQTAFGIAAP